MQDKRGEFNQERRFQRASKIHISDTFNEFVVMDFVDDGDDARSPTYKIRPQCIQRLLLWGKKKKGRTAEKSARDVLKKWVCFFGTPCIILAGKDARFSGVLTFL